MTTVDLSQIRLCEQQRNAVIFKRRLTDESGGMISADAVQVLLNLPTIEAVRNAICAREVFGVEDDGEMRFPVFQFDGGTVRPGLIAILKAAPKTSGWRLLQYLLHSEDGLAGDKPIDLMRGSKEDIERAVRFARRLEA
jgi:hypothetical protein